MEFFEFDESFVAKKPDQSAILDVNGMNPKYGFDCKGYLSRSGNSKLGGNYIGMNDGCKNGLAATLPDTNKTTTNLKPFKFDGQIKY